MVRRASRLWPLGDRRCQGCRLLLAFPLVLVACTSRGLNSQDAAFRAPDAGTELKATPPDSTGQVTGIFISAAPQLDVDILFLVDNSPSMASKQKALADNFPRMIEELDKLPDGRPNLHIGVVSSDMGAGGQGIGGNCNVVLGDRGLLWGNVDPGPAYTYGSMQECYDLR